MEHRTTRLPAEDAEAVRRRDLPRRPRRDTSNASSRPGVVTNAADLGASTLRRTARSAAHAEAYSGSAEVRQVLASPARWGHRFTDYQWTVLVLAYGEGRSDRWVARAFGDDAGNVRQARLAAEGIAWDLMHVVAPTLAKWQRVRAGNRHGETMTHEEKATLDRHRKAKKGRKVVPGVAPHEPMPAGLDVGRTRR